MQASPKSIKEAHRSVPKTKQNKNVTLPYMYTACRPDKFNVLEKIYVNHNSAVLIISFDDIEKVV